MTKPKKDKKSTNPTRTTQTRSKTKQKLMMTGNENGNDSATGSGEQTPVINAVQFNALIQGLNSLVQQQKSVVQPPAIPPLQPFKKGVESFSTYLERLDNYCLLTKTPPELKVPTLLHCLEPEDNDLLKRLTHPELPSSKTFDELVTLLKAQKDPPPNVMRARHKFSQCLQGSDSIATFKSNLKEASKYCEYDCPHCKKSILDMHLLSQFICGLKDQEIRGQLLRSKDVTTFEKAVEAALSIEASKIDSSNIQMKSPQPPLNVNLLRDTRPKRNQNDTKFSKSVKSQNTNSSFKGSDRPKCSHCGWKNHVSSDCKYKDAICKICSKKGHIATICPDKKKNGSDSSQKNAESSKQPKKINRLSDDGDSSDDSSDEEIEMYQLKTENSKKGKPIIVNVVVESATIPMEFDTGAKATVISEANFNNFLPNVKILPTRNSAKSYFGEVRKLIGRAYVYAQFNGYKEKVKLYIAKDNVTTVIGRNWLEAFRVIRKNSISLDFKAIKLLKTIDHVDVKYRSRLDNILKKYFILFDGKYGQAKNFVCSHKLLKDARPVYMKPRPLPFAIKEAVTAEILDMERAGIIERITHTSWGTPIVPIIKGSRVRICGDYKCTLNRLINDDKYPIPHIEEILSKLNGGKYFCKLDLSRAYLTLPVDDETAVMQAISTHLGTFKVNRLMFGAKTSPSIWQRYIDQLLGHLEGVTVFFDDIKIQGADQEEMLARLENVLKILAENGLKLNRDKCEFFTTSLRYLGYKIDQDGIHKTEDKIRALLEAAPPTNVSQLRSLLGLIQYYSRFCPNLATVLKPLNKRLMKDCFKWTKNCEKAFEEVKREIASDRVLVPYDPQLPVLLATDASPYGLGAVLSHIYPNGIEKPICFASRSLSETEQKYSQIDKEALGIYWGVHKFFVYLYGRHFTLVTDHRPLVQIFHPSKSLPALSTSRMLHYAIFLEGFDFEIQYRPNEKHGNADFFSRFPKSKPSKSAVDVHSILHLDIMENFPVSVAEIRKETLADPELKKLYHALLSGSEISSFADFARFKDELNIENGCIVRGVRTLIPQKLRQNILDELHFGHIGMVRMKMLARQYCFWPGIDKDIENLGRSCETCPQKLPAPNKVWHPWNYPEGPWCRLHIDYAEFEGKYLLIIVDAFSKWLEVVPTSNMTATATINILRDQFARFGLPKLVVSDNGTQFASEEFAAFIKQNGIRHAFSAPFHANSNGQAERYVRTIKEALKADTRGSFAERLARSLLGYRRAPNSTTGQSPAELMFKRPLRTRIDLIRENAGDSLRYSKYQPVKCSSYKPNDSVQYRSFGNSKWRSGTVDSKNGMVYDVVDSESGRLQRRHQDQLRHGPPETSSTLVDSQNPPEVSEEPSTSNQPSSSPPEPDPVHMTPPVRRSTRVRRPPRKFLDEEEM
ncbi:hypothetical protein V9T40_008715 [Parthenolecanium corni]|uniref:RNA-directed DNA polymerase n=1 Tax=Parthenolecanium corni TaxID=536013 RepID=A0AAN9TEJ1_9HEMI